MISLSIKGENVGIDLKSGQIRPSLKGLIAH
jgi:hypothetical protein